jgi:cytochrome c oxidase assembly protein Cox11
LPADSAVAVEVVTRKLFAGLDEPFQTSLKIRNRGEREVIARIEHRIEPKEYAGHIAMIACGFLSPMTLQPGETREVSSAYVLDPGFPKKTAFGITFKFDLASTSSAASVAERTSGAGR